LILAQDWKMDKAARTRAAEMKAGSLILQRGVQKAKSNIRKC